MVSFTTAETQLAFAALFENFASYPLVMQPVCEGAGVLKAIQASLDVFCLLESCFYYGIACELGTPYRSDLLLGQCALGGSEPRCDV